MTRKIDSMHEMFGVRADRRCEDCDNLLQGDYHGRHYRKCTVYGVSHSEASDWRKSYIACGRYNKEWTGHRTVMDLRTLGKDAPVEPCEGQMSMEDME